jgi:glutaredoxin
LALSGLWDKDHDLHNRNMFSKNSEKKLCVFCKLDHRVYLKKEVNFRDIIVLLFITGLLAFAIWGEPDLRSMLIFMTLAFIFQIFLRVRYRESVKCPHCGFDPILYKQDNKKAATKVNQFMAQRKNNPQYLLRTQPKIETVYLPKEQIQLIEREKSLSLSEANPIQNKSLERPVSGQLL